MIKAILFICITLLLPVNFASAVRLPSPAIQNADSPFFTYSPEIPWKHEIFFLDNFAIYLDEHPEMTGYIAYFSSEACPQKELSEHVNRSVKYLVEYRGVRSRRIVAFYGGEAEDSKIVLQPSEKNERPDHSQETKTSSIEDGWKNIRPMKADKASVDKLLGVPEVDDIGIYRYRTDEAFVRVIYSAAPCQPDPHDRGKFSVAAGTVIYYEVHLKKVAKLSELKFDREKYYRDTSGDVGNNILYTNQDEGVWISVTSQEGTEYVGGVTFWPKTTDKAAHSCPAQK